jgi:glyoxylase-like metal-dependent hydrolase (beta-lactamase superfamily II)
VGDEHSKEGIIIDPGDEAKKILAKVSELGLKIRLIILTHAHIDHIAALSGVKKVPKYSPLVGIFIKLGNVELYVISSKSSINIYSF